MTISNVPGPTIPLYMAGVRMPTNDPTSIVVRGVALDITVPTCGALLAFDLLACGETMPEFAELARHVGVHEALGERARDKNTAMRR